MKTVIGYFGNMLIENFDKMMNKISKKSFNAIDIIQNGAIKIESTKKRTLFCYGVKEFIERFVNEIHKE